MATSGTVGEAIISVSDLLEHSFRRAGVPTSEITPDAIKAAKNNLYFYLSQLSNAGTNLWTIGKKIIGLKEGRANYPLDIGDLDVKNVLRRTISYPSGGTAATSAGGSASNAFDQDFTSSCAQTSPNGNISYSNSNPTRVEVVGFMPFTDSYYSPVFEGSNDGISWKTFLSIDQKKFLAGEWYFYDLDNFQMFSAYRIRETSGGTLNITQISFGRVTLELPMSRMNIDQYNNLTTKNFESGFIQQYWLDRKVDAPVINTWPVSNNSVDQLVVWKTRQIQDVGDLTNTLELPQRWIDAAVTELAVKTLLELPEVKQERYDILKKEAEQATFKAQQEERDKSPIFIAPNVNCYTR